MTSLTGLEPIADSMVAVASLIDKELKNSPAALAPVMNHLAQAQGKNMRAAVVLAVARAFGKDEKTVINMACATELMHLSTLVHDDVIDDAPTRRGIASVQARFGKKTAVISGDYLFTKCFRLVAENNKERMGDFSKAIGVICVGEALQQQFNKNADITRAQYFKIIAGKTAAMFSMAVYGASKECGVKEKTAARMARAGYYLGLVFQLVDDCLDYAGDEEKTRKALYTDLEQGVITMPLIHTFATRPELKKYFGAEMTDAQKSEIISAVRNAGGVEATKALAKKYYELCRKWFTRALPRHDKNLLFGLLDMVYDREA